MKYELIFGPTQFFVAARIKAGLESQGLEVEEKFEFEYEKPNEIVLRMVTEKSE